MSVSGDDWIAKETERLVREFGAVTPPWHVFPDIHSYSIGWRMGVGKSHRMVFDQWQESQSFSEEKRIAYFRPRPAGWE